MQKVLNRGAFAQKLRIRRNIVAQTVPAVDREMLLQLAAGLDRYRALFDHEPVTRALLCNGSRNALDGREVGVTVRKRRGADANENRLPVIIASQWNRMKSPDSRAT